MILNFLRCALCAVFFALFMSPSLSAHEPVAVQPQTLHLTTTTTPSVDQPKAAQADEEDDDWDDWDEEEEEPAIFSREWMSQKMFEGKMAFRYGSHRARSWLRRNGKTIGVLALIAAGIVTTGVGVGALIGAEDSQAATASSDPHHAQNEHQSS